MKKSKNIFLLVTIGAALALIGYGVFAYTDYSKETTSTGDINYAPATEEDADFNDDVKERFVEEPDAVENQNEAKRKVTPVISAYGQPNGPGTDFRLNGYVPEVIEKGGTCTLTLSLDSQTVSISKGALQNAQNTSCGQLVVPYDKLTPGKWLATLSYKSSISAGNSNPTTVEVK